MPLLPCLGSRYGRLLLHNLLNGSSISFNLRCGASVAVSRHQVWPPTVSIGEKWCRCLCCHVLAAGTAAVIMKVPLGAQEASGTAC